MIVWRQVAERRAAVKLFQEGCHRRLVERTFMIWVEGYEGKQLEQEICRAKEVRWVMGLHVKQKGEGLILRRGVVGRLVVNN